MKEVISSGAGAPMVVEASVFWGGDLFAVRYFAVAERVVLDDVPKVAAVEVRTRLVDRAPKTPRNRWDLPLGAIALTATLLHFGVVGSLAYHETAASHASDAAYASGHELRVSSDESATELTAAGGCGARVEGEALPVGDGLEEGGGQAFVDTFGDTGLVGLLTRFRGAGGDAAMPWAPAARDPGVMWGDRIGDAWGVGGVSLSGTGQGGGGGNALGNYVVDRVHTEPALGSGHGHLSGQHTSRVVCHLGFVEAISCNRLQPEVIRRIVRSNEGRFRGCYEEGLRRDPTLAGRVVTKFVIARDGTVTTAIDGGSDLPDASVVACVNRAFTILEFPAVPDGIATVVYPIVMQPQ